MSDETKPKVLIVGAGIGGLTLAILLKKSRVPFLILERAREITPLGKKKKKIRERNDPSSCIC